MRFGKCCCSSAPPSPFCRRFVDHERALKKFLFGMNKKKEINGTFRVNEVLKHEPHFVLTQKYFLWLVQKYKFQGLKTLFSKIIVK